MGEDPHRTLGPDRDGHDESGGEVHVLQLPRPPGAARHASAVELHRRGIARFDTGQAIGGLLSKWLDRAKLPALDPETRR